MKLSASNMLKGKIIKIAKGQTTAHVTIDVNGSILTASTTNEAVEELGLAPGMDATAIIKSSDVMIGIE